MSKISGMGRACAVLLVLALICGMAGSVSAAAPTGDIDQDRTGSITVTLTSDEGNPVSDGALTIYRAAALKDLETSDWDMEYELTEDFRGFDRDVFDRALESSKSLAGLASDLADYLSLYPSPGTTVAIDGDGTAVFTDLAPGLYLIVQTERSTGFYTIDPFVVTLPQEGANGWEYDVNASPKTEVNPNPVKSVDTDGDGVYDNDGSSVRVGDVINYKIDYRNGYDLPASVVVTDVLDAGLTFLDASDGGIYDEDTRTITWTLENVNAHADGSVTFTAEVNNDALVAGEIENTADVRINDHPSSTNTIKNPVVVPLEIGKTVSDPRGRADSNTYEFQITLAGNGEPVQGRLDVVYGDGSVGTADLDDSGRVVMTLGAGETATVYVPWGTDATVTELTTGADSVTVHLDGERVVYIEDTKTQASAHLGTVKDSTQVEFVNSYRAYYGIDEEIVTDTEDIFDQDAWIKDESVNEYNAVEIEMSTMLPIITMEDLINGSFTMNFHNVLDSELVLDEIDADFSVYLTRPDGTHVQVGSEYYTVTINPDDGCSFHVDVDLTRMYLDGIITEEDLQGNTMITVFFFADLEGTDLNGSYKSTVWYEVYDGEELLYVSNVDVVWVFTFDLLITKYDAGTGEMLAGAVFGIYYDYDLADPVIRYGLPYTDDCGEEGIAEFYGLAEGTYYIAELVAPEGYQLSEEIVEIEIGLGFEPDADTIIDPADLRYEIRFADYPFGVPTPTPAPTPTPGTVPDPPVPPEKGVDTVGNGMYNNDGDEVSVGSELTYRITFYDYEDDPVTVIVTDALDEGLDFVSASDGGVYDEESRTITWTLEGVGSHENGSVTFVVKVNEDAEIENLVENTASVKIGENPSKDTNRVENPVPAVPEATPTPTPVPESPTNTTGPTGTSSATAGGTSETLPQTGMIFWPILVLACAGAALVVSGLVLRKRHYVT